MKNQKGFSKTALLIIVILVLLVIGGAYYYYKTKIGPSFELNEEAYNATKSHSAIVSKMAELAEAQGMTEETEKAISDVAALGDVAVPYLDKFIESGQIKLVEASGRALAEIGTPRAVSVLLDATARKQNNSDQKQALVSSFHALTNSASADVLIQALVNNEKDQSLAVMLRDTIARIANTDTVRSVAKTYHELKPSIVKVDEHNSFDENGLKQSYLMAIILRVSSPQAVTGLKEIVSTDSDSSLKSQAVIALGLIGTKEAIQALVDTISKTTSIAFTNVLVESLGSVNNKESVNELAQLLNQNTNENVRYGAAKALGNIPNATSRTALQNALQKETSQRVKQQIQTSLNKISI